MHWKLLCWLKRSSDWFRYCPKTELRNINLIKLLMYFFLYQVFSTAACNNTSGKWFILQVYICLTINWLFYFLKITFIVSFNLLVLISVRFYVFVLRTSMVHWCFTCPARVWPAPLLLSPAKKYLISFTAHLARRLILLNWKSAAPSTYTSWIREVLYLLNWEKIRFTMANTAEIIWNTYKDTICYFII